MRLPVASFRLTPVRPAILPGAATLVGASVLLGAISACSAGGAPAASTTSKKPASPTAPATFNPAAGPVETAAQLPKSCSSILSDTDLTAAFGFPQVGDTSYGSYAPLPNIGRTGRVTCSFDIGIDQFGRPGPAGVIVSIITYNTTTNAVSRVANDVNDTVAKGATSQPVLVSGHPATVLFEPTAVPSPVSTSTPLGSPTLAPTATSPAPPVSSAPAPPTVPSPSISASGAAPGVNELLMADGNRTFVIDIPTSKVSGSAAATTLINVMTLVYQHTLPPAALPSPPTPTAPTSPKATTSASAASPKPSAS